MSVSKFGRDFGSLVYFGGEFFAGSDLTMLVGYALINCNHAKQYWGILPVKLHRLHPETSVEDISSHPSFNRRERVLILSIMHVIWTSRNKYTRGETGFNLAKSVDIISETFQNLDFPRDKI